VSHSTTVGTSSNRRGGGGGAASPPSFIFFKSQLLFTGRFYFAKERGGFGVLLLDLIFDLRLRPLLVGASVMEPVALSPSSVSSHPHQDSAASTTEDISSLQEQGLHFSDSLKVPFFFFSPSVLANPQGTIFLLHRSAAFPLTDLPLD
jgi:hypothetical protein